MRLWVEILLPTALKSAVRRQPPCEAVSWNICITINNNKITMSASLWGCELKYKSLLKKSNVDVVSLLVRLWVEIASPWLLSLLWTSASLWGCELKCSQWVLCCSCAYCQPPCEAVSWNIPADEVLKDAGGQPPCEAVSWNSDFPSIRLVARSASLWGCELKFLCRLAILAPVPVSLLECWNAFLVMP